MTMLIHRTINIGHWRCDFFFADGDFDASSVMECLEDMGAPEDILIESWETMHYGGPNAGYTYSDPRIMASCIFVGPTTSGAEFLDTFTHELRHLADHIAQYLGIDLWGEETAYMTGDTARDLAAVVCQLGCRTCRD